MARRFLWKIGGEAGFGIMTTGMIFAKKAARMGYHVYDYNEYPSLIRGGHNTYEVLVSEDEVFMSQQKTDLLVCLNKATFELHKHRLAADSIVVYDSQDFEVDPSTALRVVNLPFKQILKDEEGFPIMMNNIALGASLALMNWDLDILFQIIEETFAKKGQPVVDKNKKVAQRGFDHVKNNYSSLILSDFPKRESESKLVVTGNDAFCLSAIVADCRLYSAYPMTPTSTVLTTLASYAESVGMIVRHAEDEISVINTALGSSWAGVRSAVGTSGGGFALMVESLSYAGVAEIPVVIFLGMRPGPATGMPTWTEQGDLLFAVHAGHGEFPKIVLAPGTVEEMYTLTAKAFDLADIYQTPVIIIADKLLCESHQSISELKFKLFSQSYKVNRGKIVSDVKGQKSNVNGAKYLRYELTDDGISPMLIPGAAGIYYQSNSYEHLEDGHTTEEAKPRIDQVDKRNRKMITYMKNHFQLPEIIGDIDKSEIVLVSWGGNKGPIIEAIKLLKGQGKETSYIHFTHVYPIDEVAVKGLFTNDKRYILIENNSHAQFGRLLRQETGVEIKEKLLKYDGRPIWPEEILNYVNNS